MFLFSKVKFSLFMVLFTSFLLGGNVYLAIIDGGILGWLFMPLSVLSVGLSVYSLGVRLMDRMYKTCQALVAHESAKLVVALSKGGAIFDPEFDPIVALSQKVIDDMAKLGVE